MTLDQSMAQNCLALIASTRFMQSEEFWKDSKVLEGCFLTNQPSLHFIIALNVIAPASGLKHEDVIITKC